MQNRLKLQLAVCARVHVCVCVCVCVRARQVETGDDFIADLFQASSQSSNHEVHQYLACSDITTTESVLNYWHRKAGIWPKLATVAVSVLSVPATSTPSERAFSLASRTLEERRTQLCDTSVDSLLFLHGLPRRD